MDAENRRHFYGALKSLPIFRANRAGNATWADHRQSLENWITLYAIDRVADIDLIKTAICHSLQDAAARAIRIYGPGTAGFVEANTTADFLNRLQSVFQPEAETSMARMDFEARVQGIREPITEYISMKIALYHASEPVAGNRNYVYLRGHVIKGIYSQFVKGQIILRSPANEEELRTACMSAVGQAREAYHLGAGLVSNLDGLASTSMREKYLQGSHNGAAGGVEDMEIGKVDREDRTCYKCQKKGHLAANCRSKKAENREKSSKYDQNLVCYYCAKTGHKKPECRKMKKDREEGRLHEDKKKKPGHRQGVRKTEDAEEDAEDEQGTEDYAEFIQTIKNQPGFRLGEGRARRK